MVKLNYDASMADVIQRAPFSVKVDPSKPLGDRFKDYIPQDSQVALTKTVDKISKKDFMKAPIHRFEEDYIGGEDLKARMHNDNIRIRALAKKMYERESKKRQDYTQAKEMIDNATRRELEFPTTELERAKRIMSKNPPLNKKSALEEAAKQYYGHNR